MKCFRKAWFLSLLLLLSSCGNLSVSSKPSGPSFPDSETPGVKLPVLEIKGRTTIGKGEYFTLKLLLDGEEIDNTEVTFQSQNRSVLTVSSTGIVKGIDFGSTKVTAVYKKNSQVKADFDIQVTQSMVPDNVIKSFIYGKTYTVKTDWNIQSLNAMTSFIQYYSDCILYQNDRESHGFANSNDGVYTFEVQDGKVRNAIFLRNYYQNYESMFITLNTLRSFSFPKSLSEDDFYPIENNSTLIQSFFLQVAQFESFTNEEIQNVLRSNPRGDFEVISPDEFKVNLYFNENDYAYLTFSRNESKNYPGIAEYLKSQTISKPALLPAIEKIYQLASSHNYYRDLGTFTLKDGTRIPIGKCYYTEKYVYFDFSDEYIKANEGDETFAVNRNGLIELHDETHDGVYHFRANKEDGQMKVAIEDKYIDEGRTYDHYYDSYENITLILDYLKNDLFRFVLNQGDENATKTSLFYNDGPLSKYLTSQLFRGILSFDGITSAGILLTIKIDDNDEKNTDVLLGGIFSVTDGSSSSNQYYNQEYSYTGFNSVHIDYLDALCNP